MSNPNENYSLSEVAGMIADSVLQEKMLSKESIITKVLVYAKAFAGIKNASDKRPLPNKNNPSLYQIQRIEAQAQYWKEVVKKYCTDYEMLKHYSNCDKMLIAKGFDIGNDKMQKNTASK